MPRVPAYLRIVAQLRAEITSGRLPPGARLPTEAELREQYGVSTTTAKNALAVLRAEGLIEGRRGSGNYVRSRPRLVRQGHGRDQRQQPGPTSPFARDAEKAGAQPRWEHSSEHTTCPPEVAPRLQVEPGTAVMRTRYRFLAGDEPIQLSTSWEPLELTTGTPVEWPEDGAAEGVVARFDTIGIRIDWCTERVADRPANPAEIEALALSLHGAQVQTIERTYYAGGRPVETADIVLVAARYTLVYEFPLT